MCRTRLPTFTLWPQPSAKRNFYHYRIKPAGWYSVFHSHSLRHYRMRTSVQFPGTIQSMLLYCDPIRGCQLICPEQLWMSVVAGPTCCRQMFCNQVIGGRRRGCFLYTRLFTGSRIKASYHTAEPKNLCLLHSRCVTSLGCESILRWTSLLVTWSSNQRHSIQLYVSMSSLFQDYKLNSKIMNGFCTCNCLCGCAGPWLIKELVRNWKQVEVKDWRNLSATILWISDDQGTTNPLIIFLERKNLVSNKPCITNIVPIVTESVSVWYEQFGSYSINILNGKFSKGQPTFGLGFNYHKFRF